MSEATFAVTVTETDEIAAGVRRLVLSRVDGGEIPAWSPGAHVDLHLPGDIVRQYSLCGDPRRRDRVEVAVLLEQPSRGASSYVHSRVSGGESLQLTGPRNNFDFEDDAAEYVFIAGGIGITPLLPMIHAVQERGARWILHYAARTRAGMAFGAQLSDAYGDHVRCWVSDEGARLDVSAIFAAASPDALIYSCGPDRLLQEVESLAETRAPGRVRVERFHPREVADRAANEAFIVELADSGLELHVPAEISILDAVRDAGVDVPSSCEEGTCGTCETVVLEGEPDHRDSVLSQMEREVGDTMMICVSRACGKRLVLEL